MKPPQTPVPENLDSLRRLLGLLDSGEAPIRLGARSRRVLAAMLEQPSASALASITELAERFDVNPSTLSRLAQRLGFSGFGGLQELFRRALTDSGSHFYSDQASLLAATAESPGLDLLARLGRQESGNIAAMVDALDPAAFDRAGELLARAPRVRLYGMRQFFALSYFLAYGLGMIRGEVAPLNAGAQGIADALAPLEPGDVLVVASCFPYTASVVRTAEIARTRGLEVVALTDSTASPLAAAASCCFLVPNQSLFYSNAMAAFFVFAEALLSEVARRLGNDAVAALRRREALISELSPLP
ncbi:MurR/RpiR family transcriptional regulator [Marinobacterium aestuariivivens]|uniref:MurR/RpiR family transcriptional regulator n=1 Tax=Marinobacterium aestuariivivens TaxID=1698799 RepID=A0ABW2A515_9GAMM